MYYYTLVNGQWLSDGDVNEKLIKLTDTAGNLTGWQLTLPDGIAELYDASGAIAAFRHPSGLEQTVANAASTPTTITDSFGRSLILSYDANNHLASLTDPAGAVTRYTYDANNNLTRVTRPDGTVRQYHYEDARFPHALTGITDERGIRYATYQYDAQGRATVTEHAGGAGRVTLVYNADGTTTATDSRGTATTYHFTTALGVVLPTLIEGPGCGACGNGDSSYTYDAANNLLTKTDHGVTTEYGDYAPMAIRAM